MKDSTTTPDSHSGTGERGQAVTKDTTDGLRALQDRWVWTTLGKTGQLLRGVSYRKEDASEQPKNDFVPILRATNIQDEKLVLASNLVYVPSRYVKAEQYLELGDIVVCMSSGSKQLVGKTAQLVQEWTGSFGTFCAAIRPHSAINSKFLGYFFSSPEYRKFIREKSAGININNLKPSDFETLEIPLPPLPEQELIVAQLEELLSDLEAGTASLERVRAGARRYKASVLKSACEGKLLGNKGSGNGKLPDGWRWATVEELADGSKYALKAGPFGSSLKKEYYVPIGYKIYGQEQVIRGDPHFGDYYIDEERYQQLKSNAVKPGDILISLVGTIGKVLILPENIEPGIINPRLVKLSLERNLIDSKYFKLYMETERARHYFSTVSHGETMEILNLGILKSLQVPLPPLEEQRRIVEEVERRLESARAVESAVEAGLKRAGRLRQALLRSAFEGRLV